MFVVLVHMSRCSVVRIFPRSVKGFVGTVRVCICLVGTYESMFSCMKRSVLWLVHVSIYWVGT